MGAGATDLLTVAGLTGVMRGFQDQREVPGDLLYMNQLPITPASEGEITTSEINDIYIADIIADDAPANVIKTGKFSSTLNNMAKIKHGQVITEKEMIQLSVIEDQNRGRAIASGNAAGAESEYTGRVVSNRVKNLRKGLWHRGEILAGSMHFGAFNYDRFGFKIPTKTWGMPSYLNIRVGTDWSDPTNGDAATDILLAKLTYKVIHERFVNRMTLGTQALRYIIAQAKFQNLAKGYLPAPITYANLSTAKIEDQEALVRNVFGVDQIRIYDKRGKYLDPDTGRNVLEPFHPLNLVVLDHTDNDKNASVQDFANGVCAEGMVQGFLGNNGVKNVIGEFEMNARGPIAYATVNPDMNPANLSMWASMRGMVRRIDPYANIVLNIGPVTDTIPFSQLQPT